MTSLIKIKDIHQCEDTGHVMLLSEQPAGNQQGPCGRPGARGHHVGDPCSKSLYRIPKP